MSDTSPVRLALLGRRSHLAQATTQDVVDNLFEARVSALAQTLEHGSDIVIDGKGRSHTSKHILFDVLMSIRDVTDVPDTAVRQKAVNHPARPEKLIEEFNIALAHAP